MDYRNAFHWYQYDPTKWFIAICNILGCASHLRVFPYNEIQKGVLTMQLKDLKKVQDSIKWPTTPRDLPVLTWEQCELTGSHAYPFHADEAPSQSKRNPKRGHYSLCQDSFTISLRFLTSIPVDDTI